MSDQDGTASRIRRPNPAEIRTAGTYAVYGTAVLASMGTLYELALNYAGWNAATAFLFAVTIDIYWLAALHTAMDKEIPSGKRGWAALHAFAAIAVSVACNILYHELHAGNWHLGHSAGALVTAGMASVPLLAAAALTHLRWLGRSAPATAASRPKPASRPRATVPAPGATAPEPSQTVPSDRPSATEPPQETTGLPREDESLPRELKAGGRPDPIAVAEARRIYADRLRGGELLTRRTLAAAVNERYGYPVIGETSAASVIDDHRSKRSA
jgi:hypothetical protein